MKYHFKIVFFIISLTLSNNVLAKKCLYISSYHQGYAWSDGIEKAIRNELKGKCEFKQFDMDTKRNKSTAAQEQTALKAKAIISSWQPDVVITSDDNAAKFLIKPYFKNHSIPFVFCGVNWNTDAYGFPYDNVTGMVEVAPIKDLFERVNTIIGASNHAFYLGADTLSERKNLRRYVQEAKNANIQIEYGLAKTKKEWLEFYQQAQQHDFIIIGSYSGINDWDSADVINSINDISKKLSITIHKWMMPMTMYGLTKIPEEQGQWAAQAALYILDGVSPKEIPIVSNRKWDVWVNQGIISKTSIIIPTVLLKKAKTYIN